MFAWERARAGKAENYEREGDGEVFENPYNVSESTLNEEDSGCQHPSWMCC